MMSHYEVAHSKHHSFYDDYEDDCIELWDNIEALQELVKNLSVTSLKMEARIAQLESELQKKKEA